MTVPCCGPKYSMCCLIVSVWGVIMLALLGIFFRIKTPILIEDLPVDEHKMTSLPENELNDYLDDLYNQASTNCFIAAAIYAGTFTLSLILWKINMRSNYSTS